MTLNQYISVVTMVFIMNAYNLLSAATEPQYDHVYHYLDKSELKELPKEPVSIQTKSKALGFGGGKSFYEVKGQKCSLRFAATQNPELIVSGVPDRTDPMTVIKFVKFEAKKKSRELTLTDVGPHVMGVPTRATKTDLNPGAITFKSTKYGKHSLKITPAQTLQPGEYGIASWNIAQNIFCFGIDN